MNLPFLDNKVKWCVLRQNHSVFSCQISIMYMISSVFFETCVSKTALCITDTNICCTHTRTSQQTVLNCQWVFRDKKIFTILSRFCALVINSTQPRPHRYWQSWQPFLTHVLLDRLLLMEEPQNRTGDFKDIFYLLVRDTGGKWFDSGELFLVILVYIVSYTFVPVWRKENNWYKE